jgi:hypothetical protein
MPSAARNPSRITARIRAKSIAARFTFSAFMVATLLAGTGADVTETGFARTDVASVVAGQNQKPPPTLWRPCPINDRANAELTLVRKFDRGPGVTGGGPTMPGGSSDLLCGTERYGYYHIVNRHFTEWTQKAAKTSENWRDVADYSIAESLRNPMAVEYRPSVNTYCYSREVALVNKVRGIIVEVMHPNVVVRAQDGAIITAFPSGKPCGS